MNCGSAQNVGILAIDIYFPLRYVAQSDMEVFDNCVGKYTKGLGQINMAFCDDREDITSIFLSVVQSLLEKYNISTSSIGRLEIGTETLIDKSKSVKTSLMNLFQGNSDMEGVTNVNACYGGTAALFNSIAWIQSRDWDGRYALVVCGDIAVYEPGPARPTGGCAAVALLLGPNAPLVFEPSVRATHSFDVYDFYKPLHSEYAMVDGKLSQRAYLTSVDKCYVGYKRKTSAISDQKTLLNITHFDYWAFHSPYNKLVQKGFGRLLLNDFLDGSTTDSDIIESLAAFKSLSPDESLESTVLEAALKELISSRFPTLVEPCCTINRQLGNSYTASVFVSLLSVVLERGPDLVGKRIGMFSFGSGAIASMYRCVLVLNTH